MFLASLSGCGTVTYIPAQGGGKRFSLEQALVAASARRAVADLPLANLDGKKAVVHIVVIADQGGGAITSGGRPSASIFASNQINRVSSFLGGFNQSTVTAGVSSTDSNYVKDLNINVSDDSLLNNLIAMKLMRSNVKIVDGSGDGQKPDYYIEIVADVFGIWRSRTDWGVKNKETLIATTSLDYLITPLQGDKSQRMSGRIGYDSRYEEKYMAWIGPVNFNITTKESIFNKYIGDLGDISKNTDSYVDFGGYNSNKKSEKSQEIIIKR
jgi:hypothetical protein